MSATLAAPDVIEAEPCISLSGVEWGQYVAISDALPDRPNLKMVYLDGSLTLLSLSRRHERWEDHFDDIIKAVARGCGIVFDISGSATLRREEIDGGLEPDRTYYFGENAVRMGGFDDIDLEAQPPPDLAIEVEVTHSADRAMVIYGRLGVPEVWRFDVKKKTLGFWSLGDDGIYRPAERSRSLPMLGPADVLGQLELARSVVPFSMWLDQLAGWVDAELVPRLERDGPRP